LPALPPFRSALVFLASRFDPMRTAALIGEYAQALLPRHALTLSLRVRTVSHFAFCDHPLGPDTNRGSDPHVTYS
jgi:hypothetical protein